MRRMLMTTLVAAAAAFAGSAGALAQGRPASPPRVRSEMRGGAGRDQGQSRAELQRRIRQAMARAAREKVGLNEAQMAKLAPVNEKYAQQRRALALDERNVRMSLRRAMMDTTNTDQAKIAEYQNRLLDLQRKRLDIVAAEQRELSTFMTPLQLAKYRALQEQLRRRADDMRRRAQPMRGPDPFGTPPDTSDDRLPPTDGGR